MSRKKRGFTLLELIIVIIVIGILASIALPRFMRVTEKARTAEAKSSLAVLRSAQIRYYAQWLEFTGDITLLDVEPDEKFFTFRVLSGRNQERAIARAMRNESVQYSLEPGGYNIFISYDGNLSINPSTFEYLL